MRFLSPLFLFLFQATAVGQVFRVDSTKSIFDSFFRKNVHWRGADGAATIDLGDGKVIWLFSDTFIGSDSSMSRKNAKIIRNSIAVQNGYNPFTSDLTFFWKKSANVADDFFKAKKGIWYWTGHGILIKGRLIIFLMKVKAVKTGLGFEVFDWSAVLVSNPGEDPGKWKMRYLDVPSSFGTIVGSAAVLKDQEYLYAYSVLESNHHVYLMRWKLEQAYTGNFSNAEWWSGDRWRQRNSSEGLPTPLFTGATEFSVHYDSLLKKYLQFQSFGFGESEIGLRVADSLQGPWSSPRIIYKPDYPGVKRPFMYSVKAHPEMSSDGLLLTYNVNSFDFGELLVNQELYFPKFLVVKIEK